MKLNILGGSYPARSSNLNCSRSVNFYPEIAPGDSKSVIALIGTPGTDLWATIGTGPITNAHVFNNLLFVVSGTAVYMVTSGGVGTVIGTITPGRCWIRDNGLTVSGVGGNQLMIVDSAGLGYIYNINTAVWSAISGGGWPSAGAASLDYIDGYFVIADKNAMSFHVSNLYDGTTWNSLATAAVTATSENLQLPVNIHQQLWLMKQASSEVWYDAGVATSVGSPFARVSGVVVDYGIAAPHSLAIADNTATWLATQKMGQDVNIIGVVNLVGYIPQLISPPAIAYQIGQMSTPSSAFAYTYSEGGHTFYVLTFPDDDSTLVYDYSTQLWHERSRYQSDPFQISRHIGNCYAYFNGRHLIGDYQNGRIYEMSSEFYDDNGSSIVSMRRSQPFYHAERHSDLFIDRLMLDMETGVGSSSGEEPKVSLRWSDDGGHVWSDGYEASMGKIGEYSKQAVWRRLGRSDNRVFEFSISASVKRVLLGAYAEVGR